MSDTPVNPVEAAAAELDENFGGEGVSPPPAVDPETRDEDAGADVVVMPTTGRSRPQQQTLMDDEGKPIAPLTDVVREYVTLRTERMEVLAQEVAKRNAIITMMREHKRTSYEDGGFRVTLKPGDDTLKVKAL